jgi:hypothetical protein
MMSQSDSAGRTPIAEQTDAPRCILGWWGIRGSSRRYDCQIILVEKTFDRGTRYRYSSTSLSSFPSGKRGNPSPSSVMRNLQGINRHLGSGRDIRGGSVRSR